MYRSSPIVYRPAIAADEPFLWTALYHAIHVPEGHPPPPMDIVHRPEGARYVQGWSAETEPGVIAESEGQPIGACWLRLLNSDNAGYGYVADDIPELGVSVLPPWRARGIGTELLSRLLISARERFRAISLSVSKTNRARGLYERFGFREVGGKGDSITMLREFR